jgi:hypothetical protein
MKNSSSRKKSDRFCKIVVYFQGINLAIVLRHCGISRSDVARDIFVFDEINILSEKK